MKIVYKLEKKGIINQIEGEELKLLHFFKLLKAFPMWIFH